MKNRVSEDLIRDRPLLEEAKIKLKKLKSLNITQRDQYMLLMGELKSKTHQLKAAQNDRKQVTSKYNSGFKTETKNIFEYKRLYEI
jgi:hypothetical protein